MKIENKGWKKPLTPSGVLSILLWIVIFAIFLALFSHYKSDGTGSPGILETVVGVLVVAIIILVVVVLVYRSALRREIAIINLLRDGEIDRFIAEMEKRLEKEKNEKRRAILNMNKSAGLIQKGQWPEAISLLNGIEFQTLTPLHRMVYVNNRLFVLLLMGNLDEARQFRADHDSLLKQSTSNPNLCDAVEGTLAVYDFYVGDIQKAEIKLNSLLNKETGRTSRAQHCYFLGLIAKRRGDRQAMNQFFNQAEDSGRNTYVPARIHSELESFVD